MVRKVKYIIDKSENEISRLFYSGDTLIFNNKCAEIKEAFNGE